MTVLTQWMSGHLFVGSAVSTLLVTTQGDSLNPAHVFPRFAIKSMEFCPDSGQLLVGGIAGQLLFCQLECKKVRA